MIRFPVAVSARGPASLETTWARKGAAGDRTALAAIVRTYQDRVYGVLFRLSGNRETALDLTQETFLKAFGALGRFREGAAFAPWLLKIANNCFLDHVRARRPESFDALGGEEPWEPGAEDPAFARIVVESDVAAALAQLPIPWRQAIVLRHVEDMTYEEMAQVLDVPLGTVKTWLFRGREKLKELLATEGDRP